MEEQIRYKVEKGLPLRREEGLWLYHQGCHALICELAQTAKSRYHKPQEATYLTMAILNYTNVCVAKCDYCAFYRLPHDSEAYLLSFDEICQKIEGVLALSGQMVGFNGGFHPKLTLDGLGEFFARIRAKYPGLTFYEMTVAEFMFYCKKDKLSYEAGAHLLKKWGCRWVPGGGAEILADSFRSRHSPGKFKVQDYFTAQKAILRAGLSSTATMVVGFDESLDERFDHLDRLRAFQDETEGGLVSFLCWTYKPYHTALGGREIDAQEYLKWLGICRIYLQNFVHIRTSVLTQNENGLLGLLYGADDFDLPTEDEVTQKAGATISTRFDELLAKAREIGIQPILREPFSKKSPLSHRKSHHEVETPVLH
jgi:cyclic dehypoxanthinyl futalosine synthase